jgi:hypothetical protein
VASTHSSDAGLVSLALPPSFTASVAVQNSLLELSSDHVLVVGERQVLVVDMAASIALSSLQVRYKLDLSHQPILCCAALCQLGICFVAICSYSTLEVAVRPHNSSNSCWTGALRWC